MLYSKGEWWRRSSGQVRLLPRFLVATAAVVAVGGAEPDDVANGGYWSRHIISWGNS